MNQKLNLSSGPHVRNYWTTRFIMLVVIAALLPATLVGIFVHGLQALWIILAAVIVGALLMLLVPSADGRGSFGATDRSAQQAETVQTEEPAGTIRRPYMLGRSL